MEKEQLYACPRCGNFTTLKLLKEIEVEEEVYDLYNEYSSFVFNYYYLFKCTSCSQVSIHGHFYTDPKNISITDLNLLYPHVRGVISNLPAQIKASYLEAKKVKNISSISFAILIRKCLEQICMHQNSKGSSLEEMITYLSKHGVLPEKIAILATLIRELGNISAHDCIELDVFDVDSIDDFFHTIANYIYSMDDQIESIREKWEMDKTPQKGR